jgi:hypothetical protein
MEIVVIMGVIFISIEISSIIKNIKEKCKLGILIASLTLVFSIFLFSVGLLGGTAYNNASTEYVSYEKGHYYLVNHNEFKEVSHDIYIYMKIIEPIGILSVLTVLVIDIYAKINEKKNKNKDL